MQGLQDESRPHRHTAAAERKSRGKPTVTVENTVVRIVLPEGFHDSDWSRLREEAQGEAGEEEEEEEIGGLEEHEARTGGFQEDAKRYSDEERDESGDEEDDQEDDIEDSEGDNNEEDDISDPDDFENNQQTSLGKRMTARQLSMAKRAEKGLPLSSEQFMDEIDPLEE